jgi:hypothetical protein
MPDATWNRVAACIVPATIARTPTFGAFRRGGPETGESLARAVGFEPTTNRLTADCSTAELRPNIPCGSGCREGAYLVASARRVNSVKTVSSENGRRESPRAGRRGPWGGRAAGPARRLAGLRRPICTSGQRKIRQRSGCSRGSGRRHPTGSHVAVATMPWRDRCGCHEPMTAPAAGPRSVVFRPRQPARSISPRGAAVA